MAIQSVKGQQPAVRAQAPQEKAPTAAQVKAANQRGATEDKAQAFVEAAEKFIGQDYKYGAGRSEKYGEMPKDPKVQPVDCSGLVTQAGAMVGANLAGVAVDQAKMGQKVDKNQLKAGDLVFRPRGEKNASGVQMMHVGIYDGKGNIIQAPQTGEQVKSEPYNPSEWKFAVRPFVGQATPQTVRSIPRSGDRSQAVTPQGNQLPPAFDF